MQTVLPFTAHCYSSRYFPIADNEPEVLPICLLPHLGIRWIATLGSRHVFFQRQEV